jgi:hypothetical protein
MCFEVMLKFARAHYYHVTDFLHLRIEPLGPVRTSKMKYTGNCCFNVLPFCVTSFSVTRVLLIAECVAETYKMRGCLCSGLDSVGNCWR